VCGLRFFSNLMKRTFLLIFSRTFLKLIHATLSSDRQLFHDTMILDNVCHISTFLIWNWRNLREKHLCYSKVNLSLCLTKHYAMKTYGHGCINPCFLDLVSFMLLSLYPRERTSDTHWIGDWWALEPVWMIRRNLCYSRSNFVHVVSQIRWIAKN
jgi:hypothetical protein